MKLQQTLGWAVVLLSSLSASAADWPALPETDQAVEIPAQEWPRRPGPRTVRILIHYPEGRLDRVTSDTGLMLTLHNWGGVDVIGTADPKVLASELNVVAIGVNYLQSGKLDLPENLEPYDFGYLQSLDALRALWFVWHGLRTTNHPFADNRIYTTGGSGGGNVSLMAQKLAPRTFTCVVDMCGMKKLSDDIAFHLPGGSPLNARYSQDAQSPAWLSPDEQAIRFVGHPGHLAVARSLGASARIYVVHGVTDNMCLFDDAEEFVANAQAAGVDVHPRFIRTEDVDGKVFTSTGHSLGNRTQIVLTTAGDVLRPGSEQLLRRKSPTDFERRDEAVRYPTPNGEFIISYTAGYPIGRFELKGATP